MANGHGGHRTPSRPAAVSGPGAHSRRTDGQPILELPDGDYGAGKEFHQLQASAPLAGGSTASGVAPGPPPAAMPVGLGEASLQPGTPVTAGAEYGAGPGPDALGIQNLDKLDAEDFAKYRPLLIDIAQRDSTPRSTKQLIRKLLSQ